MIFFFFNSINNSPSPLYLRVCALRQAELRDHVVDALRPLFAAHRTRQSERGGELDVLSHRQHAHHDVVLRARTQTARYGSLKWQRYRQVSRHHNVSVSNFQTVFQLGIFPRALRPALTVSRPARTPLRPARLIYIAH